MRKLKVIEHISLDGVIQNSADGGDFPYTDRTAPYRTPAGWDAMLAAGAEVGHGEALLCGGNLGTLIRARQHESISVWHHLQCVQGRRAFEDQIVGRPATR